MKSRFSLLLLIAAWTLVAGCGSSESRNLSPRATDPAELETVRQQQSEREAQLQQQEAQYFAR